MHHLFFWLFLLMAGGHCTGIADSVVACATTGFVSSFYHLKQRSRMTFKVIYVKQVIEMSWIMLFMTFLLQNWAAVFGCSLSMLIATFIHDEMRYAKYRIK